MTASPNANPPWKEALTETAAPTHRHSNQKANKRNNRLSASTPDSNYGNDIFSTDVLGRLLSHRTGPTPDSGFGTKPQEVRPAEAFDKPRRPLPPDEHQSLGLSDKREDSLKQATQHLAAKAQAHQGPLTLPELSFKGSEKRNETPSNPQIIRIDSSPDTSGYQKSPALPSAQPIDTKRSTPLGHTEPVSIARYESRYPGSKDSPDPLLANYTLFQSPSLLPSSPSNRQRKYNHGYHTQESNRELHSPPLRDTGAHHKANDVERNSKPPNQTRDRKSSGSKCGDLEVPQYQHTSCVKRSASRDSRRHRSRPPRGPGLNEEHHQTRRPQSRTSNISRRRSAISRPRGRKDSERKKTAMAYVAHHWNECMQIANEEKEEANREIDQLHEKVRQKNRELEKARHQLNQTEIQVKDLESSYLQMEQQHATTTSDNAGLGSEMGKLRKQLAETKGSSKLLAEKCKTLREKLNEAIQEQQDLYTYSQSYSAKLQSELQLEKASKEAKCREIDLAIKSGRQKREEMKNIIEDMQSQAQNESQHQQETISMLRSEIQEQQESLKREQNTTDALRLQAESVQENQQQKLEFLDAKLDQLIDTYRSKDEAENSHASAAVLSEKVDFIMNKLESSSSDNHQALRDIKSSIEPLFQVMGAQVVSGMQPYLQKGEERFIRLENTLSKLGREFGDELVAIKQAIAQQTQKRLEYFSEFDKTRENSANSVDQIYQELRATREVCEGLRDDQLDLGKHLFASLETTLNDRHDMLEEIITQQGEATKHRDRKLQSVAADYAAKIEANHLRQGCWTTEDRSAAERLLRTKLDQMGQKLVTEFHQAKDESAQRLNENEQMIAACRKELKNVMEAISEVKAQDALKLQEQLGEERRLNSDLVQKMQNLESRPRANEELQEKWRKDINNIATIKAKLATTLQRLPRVERTVAKLHWIMRLNSYIHSTAMYFAEEKDWLHRELSEKCHPSQQRSAQGSVIDVQPSASMATRSATPNAMLQSLISEASRDISSIQEEIASSRTVMVYSPTGVSDTAAPLSISQEQRKRRERSRPRPILKYSDDMFHEMVTAEGDSAMENGQGTNSDIQEQIRSGLVPSRPSDNCKLPTIAEFEQSTQLQTKEKRENSGADEIEDVETEAKRAKVDNPANKPASQSISRPSKRTYSRKTEEAI